MARSRNIKPGFFENDELAELSTYSRLLFIGLWCIADREGRLEDKPKKIKAQIFPYEDIEINDFLDELFEHKFVIRYEIDGNRYIWIPKFLTHQNPHPKEKESEIPAYKENTEIKLNYTASNENTGTRNADSLIPHPDSLTHDAVPYQELVEAFNLICESLPKVRDLTEKRKKSIKARWIRHPGINFYKELFRLAQDSLFLTGSNDRNWRADFDWLMNEQNLAKVIEHKYDNTKPRLVVPDRSRERGERMTAE